MMIRGLARAIQPFKLRLQHDEVRSEPMSKLNHGDPEKEQLTLPGCVLTVLSTAVIFGTAIPIVLWRDSAGRPLPRFVALAAPLLIGGAFHGLGTVILWLFGLRVMITPSSEKSDWPEL
jgi:hypothetical protein